MRVRWFHGDEIKDPEGVLQSCPLPIKHAVSRHPPARCTLSLRLASIRSLHANTLRKKCQCGSRFPLFAIDSSLLKDLNAVLGVMNKHGLNCKNIQGQSFCLLGVFGGTLHYIIAKLCAATLGFGI